MLKIKNIVALVTMLAGIGAGQVWGMEEDAKAFVIGVIQVENNIEVYGEDIKEIPSGLECLNAKLNGKNVYKVNIEKDSIKDEDDDEDDTKEYIGKTCTIHIGNNEYVLSRLFNIRKNVLERFFIPENGDMSGVNQFLTILLELLPGNPVIKKKCKEAQEKVNKNITKPIIPNNLITQKNKSVPSTLWRSIVSGLTSFVGATLNSYIAPKYYPKYDWLTTGGITAASAFLGISKVQDSDAKKAIVGSSIIGAACGKLFGKQLCAATCSIAKKYFSKKELSKLV